MSAKLSVPDIVARLEAQVAFHQEREAFHAQHEALHREQRALHAAELEKVSQNLAAFQASATMAMDLAGRRVAPRSQDLEDLGPGSRPRLARIVAKVVQGIAPTERFGASRVTAEIDRRYGAALRRPADPRLVSIILRRMGKDGRLHQVRRGRPHWEALYTRETPGAG